MSEKPILFSGPMVRAILDGRKTVTRRVITPTRSLDLKPGDIIVRWGPQFGGTAARFRPSYAPGDRLWVREGWAHLPKSAYGLPKTADPNDVDMAAYYRADFDRSGKPAWRPSIHMPRWASRLTLKVTDVKVERLQDISEEEAKAEGVFFYDDRSDYPWTAYDGCSVSYPHARDAFGFLWTRINGKRPGCAWDDNPWVAAISFRKVG
jgi:hypothetical protein